MSSGKQLYRVEEGKIFSGVCAGIAEYFNMDVGLVRVIFALAFVFSGFFPIIILYVILAAILPSGVNSTYRNKGKNKEPIIDEDEYSINEDDYKY